MDPFRSPSVHCNFSIFEVKTSLNVFDGAFDAAFDWLFDGINTAFDWLFD
jgi:hypothetical protein